MIAESATLGAIAIALAGILIIAGARKLGLRLLAAAIVFIVAATALAPKSVSSDRAHAIAE